MKKSLLISLAILAGVVGAYVAVFNNSNRTIVQAVGDVTAVFESSPLFMVTNWLPGDSETKTFEVTNDGTSVFQLAIRTENESSIPTNPDLANVSDVVISDNEAVTWYGTGSAGGVRTLANLYGEPFVMLGNINTGETRTFSVKVSFPPGSGNEYQKTRTQFDIVLMEEALGPNGETIPNECKWIAFGGAPIIGTSGKDRLIGNLQNNLIFGLDGDDFIMGNGGHDCIIGGSGKDRVMGGTGKDFIWGEDGDDNLDGGSDEDMVWAGEGNDKMDGGSDPDKLYGGNGNDEIDGGSGNDEIYGDNGNDKIDGGSGIDKVWGGDGDDDIKGGTSDDFLYGDGGNDKTDGQTGIDLCVAEVKNRCEL